MAHRLSVERQPHRRPVPLIPGRAQHPRVFQDQDQVRVAAAGFPDLAARGHGELRRTRPDDPHPVPQAGALGLGGAGVVEGVAGALLAHDGDCDLVAEVAEPGGEQGGAEAVPGAVPGADALPEDAGHGANSMTTLIRRTRPSWLTDAYRSRSRSDQPNGGAVRSSGRY